MQDDASFGQYKLGDTIGEGQFGKVKVAEHTTTRQKVALKILSNQKIDRASLQREIDVQRLVSHPYVVKLHDVIETESITAIALEFVPGGDLLEFLLSQVRLPEDEARRLFQQLIVAVQHCHRCMVAHRDIKPENILLDANRNIRLADFGLAVRFQEGETLTESCGSPNYAAPELLSRGCNYKGPEVDVWSCGVVLYTLLCNSLPFDADNLPELFKRIKQGSYRVPGYVSTAAKDLIDRMLTVDAAKRISMEQICQHPWFNKNLPAELQPTPLPSAFCSVAGESVTMEPEGRLRQSRINPPLSVEYKQRMCNRSASTMALSSGAVACISLPRRGCKSFRGLQLGSRRHNKSQIQLCE